VLFFNGIYLAFCDHIDGGVLVLCSIIGGLSGWALAVLATPADEDEGLKFNAYAKVISGFLSGFLFVKLNDLVSADRLGTFLNKDDNLRVAGFACGYAIAFFLIGLMWTFLVRMYTRAEKNSK
jgi:hypothetical protein